MTLNKQKTALLNAYIHQTDTEVSRFMFSAPFITNTDYNNLMDDISSWITLSATGQLNGTNDNNTTFTYASIDTEIQRPHR